MISHKEFTLLLLTVLKSPNWYIRLFNYLGKVILSPINYLSIFYVAKYTDLNK
jgi:hypothetical protein